MTSGIVEERKECSTQEESKKVQEPTKDCLCWCSEHHLYRHHPVDLMTFASIFGLVIGSPMLIINPAFWMLFDSKYWHTYLELSLHITICIATQGGIVITLSVIFAKLLHVIDWCKEKGGWWIPIYVVDVCYEAIYENMNITMTWIRGYFESYGKWKHRHRLDGH